MVKLSILVALFDQGSQKSFILDKLVYRLKMRKVDKIREAVDGFNKQGNVKEYNVVEFSIFSADGPVIVQAFVVDSFPSRISMIGRGNLVHKLKLEGYFLADPNQSDFFGDVELLIGGDQYYNFFYDNSVFENAHLIPSNLGILLAGNTVANGKAKSDNASVMCHINCNNDSLDNELQNL